MKFLEVNMAKVTPFLVAKIGPVVRERMLSLKRVGLGTLVEFEKEDKRHKARILLFLAEKYVGERSIRHGMSRNVVARKC